MPGLEIKKITSPIPVRGVSNKIVQTDEYIIITIYIIGTISDVTRTAFLTMKVHLVNNLKVNILIGTDIMIPQGMIINLEERTCRFEKYQDLIVPIDVVTRTQPHSKRTIRATSFMTIAPDATTEVPVAYKGVISDDRDFLFEPDCS